MYTIAILLLFLLVVTQSIRRDANEPQPQLLPLNGTLQYDRLKATGIILWDKYTVLITQFSSGKKRLGKREFFYFVGAVTVSPATRKKHFIHLEFANGAEASIRVPGEEIKGKQMFLKVPETSNYTVADFHMIALVDKAREIKTYVDIDPNNVNNLPDINPRYDEDNSYILVYPKCCPLDSFLGDEQCQVIGSEHIDEFERAKPIDIHELKARDGIEKYNTNAMDIHRVPIYSPPSCDIYVLEGETDQFAVTHALELFIDKHLAGPISCMDFTYDEQHVGFQENVFVCSRNQAESLKAFTVISSLAIIFLKLRINAAFNSK